MVQTWVKERPPAPWRGLNGGAPEWSPTQEPHLAPSTDAGLLPKVRALAPQQPLPPHIPLLANRFSVEEYRAHLVSIYAVHKQDNVPKVDYLLRKYSGNEEYLFQTVCAKYHVDPNSVLGLPPAPEAALQMPALHAAVAAGQPLASQAATEPMAAPQGPPAGLTAALQCNRVMEWDPATGTYVETTIEFDEYPEEVANQLKSFTGAAPRGAAAASLLMAVEDPEEEEEYDPFSTGPEQVPKDPVEAMVQIDFLLLGERSGFFEEPSAAGVQGADPVVVPPEAPPAADVQRAEPTEAPSAAGSQRAEPTDAPPVAAMQHAESTDAPPVAAVQHAESTDTPPAAAVQRAGATEASPLASAQRTEAPLAAGAQRAAPTEAPQVAKAQRVMPTQAPSAATMQRTEAPPAATAQRAEPTRAPPATAAQRTEPTQAPPAAVAQHAQPMGASSIATAVAAAGLPAGPAAAPAPAAAAAAAQVRLARAAPEAGGGARATADPVPGAAAVAGAGSGAAAEAEGDGAESDACDALEASFDPYLLAGEAGEEGDDNMGDPEELEDAGGGIEDLAASLASALQGEIGTSLDA